MSNVVVRVLGSDPANVSVDDQGTIKGQDGFSPVVETSAITGGHTVTITDATGEHSFDVMDGQDGAPGQDGEQGQQGIPGADGQDGADGFSPIVSVTDIIGGHTVTITDATGEHSFDVMDGADGTDGQDGQDGTDGVSPAVTVTDIAGGHRVTITDADHPTGQSFDVMDGAGAVASVNGMTGTVTLDADDVGALSTSGDGSNVTAAFTAASSRVNISTGEKLSVLFGKIAKWFSDLGSAAFRAATSSITSGSTDLVESGAVYTGLSAKYEKPSGGIPDSDIASASTWNAKGTYSKPSGGIPKTDLESAVQTSLGKADTALQSHQDISGKADKVQSATNGNFAGLDANGNLTDSGHKHSDYLTQHQSLVAYRTAAAQDVIDAAQDADIASRAKADEIGIVITGARPSMVVSAGQYVIVRGSTITGIADGLYKAINALSPSTDVTAADLTAVSDGGLNEVKTACTPIIQSIGSDIPKNSGHVSVTAPTVNGYTFWYWLKAVSIGWVGVVYHEQSFSPTTDIWALTIESKIRHVDSYAVYRKS